MIDFLPPRTMNRDEEQQAEKLTGEEIAKHSSKDSCWVIIHGKAYDVTEASSKLQFL